MIRRPLRLFTLTLPLLLAACGGTVPGTSTGGTTGNSAPEAAILSGSGAKLSGSAVVSPGAEFTLNVSDSDGTVTRVNWTVTRGTTTVASGEFSGAEVKAKLPLTLPTLAGGAYVLTVKATDDDGATGTASATFIVDAAAPTLTTVTLNGTAVADGGAASLKVGAVGTLVASATDDLSGATVLVYQGNTLIARGSGSVSVDIAGSAAGTVTYKVVAVDAVGNSSPVRSFSVTYEATTGETPAPTPVLQINNQGDGPYSSVLSVTVSAGVAAGVGVKQVILEVTDAGGIVDTTTYVSSSENATFNIDTTKYPDGDLRLRVIAIDATGQRGVSAFKTVQISNRVAPTLSFVTPSNGADVTGPTTVVLQLRQNNTAFTFTKPTENVLLKVTDGRGQLITTQTATFTLVNEGLYQATTTIDFNATQYLNATYTLQVETAVVVGGETQTLTAQSTVNNLSRTVEPPALNILLPAYYEAVASKKTILTRKSAVALQVSDSDEIRQVQLQFTCDESNPAPGQNCNTSAYNFNIPIGEAGIFYPVFNTGVLIDGQPYVPDGNYVMRATAVDVAGNSNIKEMPVVVDRSQATATKAGIANLGYNVTTTTDDGVSKFIPTTATWAIQGTPTNTLRLLTLTTIDGVTGVGIDPQYPGGSPISTTFRFGKAGTYSVSYLAQDLTTGVVEYYPGGGVQVTTRE